jgi:hypothetical protein
MEFGKYVTNHWRELLAGWKGSSPTHNQAELVMNVAESLSPAEYVRFLSQLVDLCETGRIKISELWYAIAGNGKKEGFVAFNYQNPDLQAILVRCEKLAAARHDQQRVAHYADMRAGKLRDDALDMAGLQSRRKLETLPVNVLPPSERDSTHGTGTLNSGAATLTQPPTLLSDPSSTLGTTEPLAWALIAITLTGLLFLAIRVQVRRRTRN